MVLRLLQIGNSKGIRLPKKIIERFNFKDEIEVEIKEEGLLLRGSTKARVGWKEGTDFKRDRKGWLPGNAYP
jgi:antitoxin MazE